MPAETCPLCTQAGGALLWRGTSLRVIAVADADYPGFTRVVLNDHVAEMTDLPQARRDDVMRVVYLVEEVMRRTLAPDKVNLAAFGNVVPHLHWHVIPRWRDDRHFPDPYWAPARVLPGQEPQGWEERRQMREQQVAFYHQALVAALNASVGSTGEQ